MHSKIENLTKDIAYLRQIKQEWKRNLQNLIKEVTILEILHAKKLGSMKVFQPAQEKIKNTGKYSKNQRNHSEKYIFVVICIILTLIIYYLS